MGKFQKDLPKIVQEVLKDEKDETVKTLVKSLLHGVLTNQNKIDIYPQIKKTLDDSFEAIQKQNKILRGEI